MLAYRRNISFIGSPLNECQLHMFFSFQKVKMAEKVVKNKLGIPKTCYCPLPNSLTKKVNQLLLSLSGKGTSAIRR